MQINPTNIATNATTGTTNAPTISSTNAMATPAPITTSSGLSSGISTNTAAESHSVGVLQTDMQQQAYQPTAAANAATVSPLQIPAMNATMQNAAAEKENAQTAPENAANGTMPRQQQQHSEATNEREENNVTQIGGGHKSECLGAQVRNETAGGVSNESETVEEAGVADETALAIDAYKRHTLANAQHRAVDEHITHRQIKEMLATAAHTAPQTHINVPNENALAGDVAAGIFQKMAMTKIDSIGQNVGSAIAHSQYDDAEVRVAHSSVPALLKLERSVDDHSVSGTAVANQCTPARAAYVEQQKTHQPALVVGNDMPQLQQQLCTATHTNAGTAITAVACTSAASVPVAMPKMSEQSNIIVQNENMIDDNDAAATVLPTRTANTAAANVKTIVELSTLAAAASSTNKLTNNLSSADSSNCIDHRQSNSNTYSNSSSSSSSCSSSNNESNSNSTISHSS